MDGKRVLNPLWQADTPAGEDASADTVTFSALSVPRVVHTSPQRARPSLPHAALVASQLGTQGSESAVPLAGVPSVRNAPNVAGDKSRGRKPANALSSDGLRSPARTRRSRRRSLLAPSASRAPTLAGDATAANVAPDPRASVYHGVHGSTLRMVSPTRIVGTGWSEDDEDATNVASSSSESMVELLTQCMTANMTIARCFAMLTGADVAKYRVSTEHVGTVLNRVVHLRKHRRRCTVTKDDMRALLVAIRKQSSYLSKQVGKGRMRRALLMSTALRKRVDKKQAAIQACLGHLSSIIDADMCVQDLDGARTATGNSLRAGPHDAAVSGSNVGPSTRLASSAPTGIPAPSSDPRDSARPGLHTDPTLFWGLQFGRDTVLVPWDRFVAAFDAHVYTCTEEQRILLAYVLDHGQTNHVSQHKFLEFVKAFGPLRLCVMRLCDIMPAPWFHGYTTPQDSARMLTDAQPGTYLVRFGRSQPSVFCVDFVLRHGQVNTVVVQAMALALVVHEVSGNQRAFGTLHEVVEFYHHVFYQAMSCRKPVDQPWYCARPLSPSEVEQRLAGKRAGSFIAYPAFDDVDHASGCTPCAIVSYVSSGGLGNSVADGDPPQGQVGGADGDASRDHKVQAEEEEEEEDHDAAVAIPVEPKDTEEGAPRKGIATKPQAPVGAPTSAPPVIMVRHVALFKVGTRVMARLSQGGALCRWDSLRHFVASNRRLFRYNVVEDPLLVPTLTLSPKWEKQYVRLQGPQHPIEGPFDAKLGTHAYGESKSAYPDSTGAWQVICDYFGMMLFPSRTVFCVTDGCNWGHRPQRASEVANNAFLRVVDRAQHTYRDTTQISRSLANAVNVCHQKILASEPDADTFDIGTTTLCGGIVVQLNPDEPDHWAMVCVNLGDCKVYHVCASTGTVRDVTSGNRVDVFDASDPGGRLGPYGPKGTPDLRNLATYYEPCRVGDVFLVVSDGVYDNLDPEKLSGPVQPHHVDPIVSLDATWTSLDHDTASRLKQRYACAFVERLWAEGKRAPQSLTRCLVRHALDTTSASRRFMDEFPKLSLPTDYEAYPGKMDHVTCAAFCVGPVKLPPEACSATSAPPLPHSNIDSAHFCIPKKHKRRSSADADLTGSKRNVHRRTSSSSLTSLLPLMSVSAAGKEDVVSVPTKSKDDADEGSVTFAGSDITRNRRAKTSSGSARHSSPSASRSGSLAGNRATLVSPVTPTKGISVDESRRRATIANPVGGVTLQGAAAGGETGDEHALQGAGFIMPVAYPLHSWEQGLQLRRGNEAGTDVVVSHMGVQGWEYGSMAMGGPRGDESIDVVGSGGGGGDDDEMDDSDAGYDSDEDDDDDDDDDDSDCHGDDDFNPADDHIVDGTAATAVGDQVGAAASVSVKPWTSPGTSSSQSPNVSYGSAISEVLSSTVVSGAHGHGNTSAGASLSSDGTSGVGAAAGDSHWQPAFKATIPKQLAYVPRRDTLIDLQGPRLECGPAALLNSIVRASPAVDGTEVSGVKAQQEGAEGSHGSVPPAVHDTVSPRSPPLSGATSPRTEAPIASSRLHAVGPACAQVASLLPLQRGSGIECREGDPISVQYRIRVAAHLALVVMCRGVGLGNRYLESARVAADAFVAFLAARCSKIVNTAIAATWILRAAHEAQNAVLDMDVPGRSRSGTCTLIGGVLLKLRPPQGVGVSDPSSQPWAFVGVNVGDSKAFHVDRRSGSVVDITSNSARFVESCKDVGGRLGRTTGAVQADLRNFGLYHHNVLGGDLLLLMTQGAHMNFDPEYNGLAPSVTGLSITEWSQSMWSETEPFRCAHRVKLLAKTLATCSDVTDVKTVVAALIQHCVDNTHATRLYLQSHSGRVPTDRLRFPGYLDHAACVCLRVASADEADDHVEPDVAIPDTTW